MTEDYFAELYVAGVLAKAGWNVYFPHRDQGFDFIISKQIETEIILRPVQVKGKYPEEDKTNKNAYGYVGNLTQLHPEMVLVIPYFKITKLEYPPAHIAFMPRIQIKKHARGHRCEPAVFKNGEPKPRRDYLKFFDGEGLKLLESKSWNATKVSDCL